MAAGSLTAWWTSRSTRWRALPIPYVPAPYQGFERSAGVTLAPGTTGAPSVSSSGIAELGASSSGVLTGSSGGTYTAYQISSPSGKTVTLTLTYGPVQAPNGHGIGLEVYQAGSKLGNATDSNDHGTVVLKVTPSSGSAALIKVASYLAGMTISYTLTQS